MTSLIVFNMVVLTLLGGGVWFLPPGHAINLQALAVVLLVLAGANVVAALVAVRFPQG